MSNDRQNIIKIGKIIVDAQEEIGNIREVLKNLPGFPQGKVPVDVKIFSDRIELMNKNLQNCKNGCVEFLVNEDTKEPQSFKHFNSNQTPSAILPPGQSTLNNTQQLHMQAMHMQKLHNKQIHMDANDHLASKLSNFNNRITSDDLSQSTSMNKGD